MWGGKRENAGRKKGQKDQAQRFIAATMASEYTEQMAFRCSEEHRKRLEAYARRRGLTVAEAMRRLIETNC